jgi:hypothetical protein
MRLTGATDHAVKRVLANLATERHQPTMPSDTPDTSAGGPGQTTHTPLALVTTSPADPHHQHALDDDTQNYTSAGGQHQPSHQAGGAEHHEGTSPGRHDTSHTANPTRPTTNTGDQRHQPRGAGDAGATSHHQTTSAGDPHHQPGGDGHHQAASPGDPHHQPTPTGGRLVAWTGFLFGSITSIAANVLHAWLPAGHQPPSWTPGLAPQIGAAVWPLGLMLAVEALSRIRWPTGLGWALARYGGAGTVALGSATISYGHVST